MDSIFAPKITHRIAGFYVNPAIQMFEELPKENWARELNDVLPYGWAGELAYPNTQGFEEHFRLYKDMVEHIMSNVANPHDNVLWTKIGDCIYVKFRKEKDLMWFKLRFGV
jgi:hypothetical protein